ncbi:MAG: VOC family protein [Xanthobacteraceae bacterium]|nr:VOC family protein [Xanthobacteraceae bacterium]
MHPLDHIMLAAPDLQAAVADFEQRTGVRPSEGGRHPGQGSRNVLATVGNGCYLEIIGPDLSQDRTNNFGEVLSRLSAPTLLKFASGTHDIAAVHQRAIKFGLWPLASSGARTDGPFAMSRALPSGEVLKWRLLLLGSGDYEGYLPFFIQWDSEPHPSQTAAGGCELERFWVEHPSANGLAKLYSELEVAVDVLPSDRPRLNLTLRTPKGRVTF